MKSFALTGHPIAHSKNPCLFAAAYHGKYAYELLPAGTAEDAMRLFKDNALEGMNVTMPLKAAIIPFMDELDDTVRLLNAANVVVKRNGKLKAYNTDVCGVSGALEAAGVELYELPCLVLGGGGAARAAVAALYKAGAHITVANRTMSKAEDIAGLFDAHVVALEKALQHTSVYNVIVNTTPAGSAIADRLQLGAGQTVLDADYANQPLKEVTLQAGAFYVDGTQWLLHQAFPAYRLFTGEEPDIPAMLEVMNNMLMKK